MADLGGSEAGRASIASALRLCGSVRLESLSDVLAVRDWLASAL
jgi:hypothetical protein